MSIENQPGDRFPLVPIMSSIAYLEISPRQAGKTTRLVHRARDLTENNQRVCFVTLKGMKREVQRALPRALVLADGEPFPPGENPAASVWFYDEFDWLQSAIWRPGAYYATSPRFIRRPDETPTKPDLLLDLVKRNGYRFERYYWPWDMEEVLREGRALHSAEEFRRLYLGEFLE